GPCDAHRTTAAAIIVARSARERRTMARHGDQSRQALLDAAEELFATQGIDSVSNRRIAEFAGQANHSAVAYHFGGRDDLIRAIFDRHEQPVRGRRAELAARLPADPEVTDHLRCLVV